MIFRNFMCVVLVLIGGGLSHDVYAHPPTEKSPALIAPLVGAPLMGMWLTSDKQAVVLIQECAVGPRQYCGYLVGFEPSGEKLIDRVLCGMRIVGGLTSKNDTLVSGWLAPPEDDNVYNIEVKLHGSSTVDAPVLGLKVYGKVRVLSETLEWTRFDVASKGSTLKMCYQEKI
ncbi:MAG: hypothetical protein COA43_05750 [Robiginitomaculum sp.]|nr:MAG: hypothetical protein COA43_05750 [Robiginitomaculum sp.]